MQVWIPSSTKCFDIQWFCHCKGPIPQALGQLPFVKLQLLGDADGQGKAKIYDLRHDTQRDGEDVYIYIYIYIYIYLHLQ